MKSIIPLIISFLLLLCQNLVGQNSSIFGKVVYEKSHVPVDSLRIDLLDSLEIVIKTEYTNFQGYYKIDDIQPGTYQLFAKNNDNLRHYFTGISIGILENIEFDLAISDLCQSQLKTNVCPYCNSTQKVRRIAPGTVVLYNFGDNTRAIKNYDRKIRKSRYESYVNEDGEEIIIAMHIESEKEKFWNICHKWFCKKCKKVF